MQWNIVCSYCVHVWQRERSTGVARGTSVLFYSKVIVWLVCVCVPMKLSSCFWKCKPRDASVFNSICICLQTQATMLVYTHMLKVFVTPLTRSFSVLLLPWKHGNHGNKRCQFWGGWSAWTGGRMGVVVIRLGVFLSKSRPCERDSDSERCKYVFRMEICFITCCPREMFQSCIYWFQ